MRHLPHFTYAIIVPLWLALAAAGVDPWPGTPEDLALLVKNETARYAAIAKKAGLRPE